MITILVNELDIMGGTHKQVLRFVEYLKRNNKEYQIVTKKYDKNKTYSEFESCNIISLKKHHLLKKFFISNTLFDFFLQLLIIFKINKDSRIINIHDNGFPFLILLASFTNKKIFWQINDLPWSFQIGNAKLVKATAYKKMLYLFSKKFYQYIAKNCVEKITVNVTKNKERVFKYLNSDSTVLYCGVDSWPSKKIIRDNINNEINILTSGVFFEYRNYETQLKVVNLLLEKGKKVYLNIIGSTALAPEYYQKINDMIKYYNLEDNVKIHGQVDYQKYIKLHEKSNLFLFLNIDQSWGLSIFEAMSSGLPTIISNSVGACEVLTNNLNTLIVDPVDVSEILSSMDRLTNKNFYDQIVHEGFQRVNKMTWDKEYSEKLYSIMMGNL